MSFFSFFSKSNIVNQLQKTSSNLGKNISQIFFNKKLDAKSIEELEDVLIEADIGSKTSLKIIEKLRNTKFSKDVDSEFVKKFLIEEISQILQKSEKKINFNQNENKPIVITFTGINGVGKTTTIGKMAFNLTNQGKKVVIAACDTFRAAAEDQLKIWADRSNCQIISAIKDGEDPAAVAFRAFNFAKENSADVLLLDTAGRLQNKKNLMDELKKINNVIKKIDNKAPHENLLILDATIGQNAKNQFEVFNETINISGLIITKLDGTAKGGMLISIADEYQKPIYAIGVGEKIEDLQEFNANIFANNLFKSL